MSFVDPGFAVGVAGFAAAGAGALTSAGGAGASATGAGVSVLTPDFAARILARISAVDSFGSDMTLHALETDRARWARSKGEVKRGRILATHFPTGNLCESRSSQISQTQDRPENHVLMPENLRGDER